MAIELVLVGIGREMMRGLGIGAERGVGEIAGRQVWMEDGRVRGRGRGRGRAGAMWAETAGREEGAGGGRAAESETGMPDRMGEGMVVVVTEEKEEVAVEMTAGAEDEVGRIAGRGMKRQPSEDAAARRIASRLTFWRFDGYVAKRIEPKGESTSELCIEARS